MSVTIYECVSEQVIEIFEGDWLERAKKLDSLRDKHPDHIYTMVKDDQNPQEKMAEARERELERRKLLAQLPPVEGEPEITREQWDEAMTKLSPNLRGKAANLAAHSWAILPHDDGLILVGHTTGASFFSGDVPTVLEDAPHICQNCTFSKRYAESMTKGLLRPLRCSAGYDEFRLNRAVGRTNTCSGWKQA